MIRAINDKTAESCWIFAKRRKIEHVKLYIGKFRPTFFALCPLT